MIIKEHYRLGSNCVILSRSFCNANDYTDFSEIEKIFDKGIKEIRNLEFACEENLKNKNYTYFSENKTLIDNEIKGLYS